jgi:hypothetical protein
MGLIQEKRDAHQGPATSNPPLKGGKKTNLGNLRMDRSTCASKVQDGFRSPGKNLRRGQAQLPTLLSADVILAADLNGLPPSLLEMPELLWPIQNGDDSDEFISKAPK